MKDSATGDPIPATAKALFETAEVKTSFHYHYIIISFLKIEKEKKIKKRKKEKREEELNVHALASG